MRYRVAKELERFLCTCLVNKFIADVIITKLLPSWRDFATSLKKIRDKNLAWLSLLGLLMLRKGREQKAYMKNGLSLLLLIIWERKNSNT